MSRRTSVWLPDDVDGQVRASKASGVKLVDLIRRGLQPAPAAADDHQAPADTGRLAAVEQRIAAVEQRMAQLEARQAAVEAPAADFGLIDPDEDGSQFPAPETVVQAHEDAWEARAGEWHRRLLDRAEVIGGEVYVTAADAAGHWRCSDTTARDRLRVMTSMGLAAFLDDETPYRWLITGSEDAPK